MVQEQPSRVERRLSAILAADVAGYSRLMGRDEAGTANSARTPRYSRRGCSETWRTHRQDHRRRCADRVSLRSSMRSNAR
jgi:hypothetical protein